jgi:hypothetical protein
LENGQTSLRPAKSRRWVWYFVVLGILTVLAVGIQVGYNLRQQLKLEQVEAARALWQEKQPRDYQFRWTKKAATPETFIVWVRNGRVVAAVMKPGETVPDEKATPLPPRLYSSYDVPALFDFLDDFLRMDAQPGSRRAFNRAIFDAEDGHLVHFRRSVMGTGQAVEIGDVQLTRESPGAPLPDFVYQKRADPDQ